MFDSKLDRSPTAAGALQRRWLGSLLPCNLLLLKSRLLLRYCWWLLILVFPLLTGFGPPRVIDSPYTPLQQVQIGNLEACKP
ncbi:MAG: hypothetical protein R2867_00910 [Caldilineaceae bacterium]